MKWKRVTKCEILINHRQLALLHSLDTCDTLLVVLDALSLLHSVVPSTSCCEDAQCDNLHYLHHKNLQKSGSDVLGALKEHLQYLVLSGGDQSTQQYRYSPSWQYNVWRG